MPHAVKLTIIAIIAGLATLNGLSKESKENDIILDKLEYCGLNIDNLDDGTKDELVNMTEGELYQICEHSLKTQEILRSQQQVIDTLNSINIK